jgi:hypothetical protein
MTRETDDINFKAILRGVLIFIVAIVVIQAVLWVGYAFMRRRIGTADVSRTLVAPSAETPSEPLLQVSPRIELREFKRSQMEQLESYGWTSREQGKVRIPIERAMELMAESEN